MRLGAAGPERGQPPRRMRGRAAVPRCLRAAGESSPSYPRSRPSRLSPASLPVNSAAPPGPAGKPVLRATSRRHMAGVAPVPAARCAA